LIDGSGKSGKAPQWSVRTLWCGSAPSIVMWKAKPALTMARIALSVSALTTLCHTIFAAYSAAANIGAKYAFFVISAAFSSVSGLNGWFF
jgi:hypothetical protein